MMRPRSVGLVLFLAGLFMNNYGFLHDLVWAKHDGAIFMGLHSYLTVVMGAVLTIGGMLLVWRTQKVTSGEANQAAAEPPITGKP